MMVIFLVGLVTMILLRTLRKDYARYTKEAELDDLVRYWVFRNYEPGNLINTLYNLYMYVYCVIMLHMYMCICKCKEAIYICSEF